MYDMTEIGILRQNMIRLSRRAATCRDFRNLCLESAADAYLELTGQPLPELHMVCFIEPENTELPVQGKYPYFYLPRYLAKTWLG